MLNPKGSMRAQLAGVISVCSLVLVFVAWLASSGDASRDAWPPPLDDLSFWSMTEEFSEPAGTFTPTGGYRTDHLLSNERSLQQVMPQLLHLRRSGAYLGVGPEQNFTYIASHEPAIAFVIDIRRENLLLHLVYKALAEESNDRSAFLARLFGRDAPPDVRSDAPVQALFDAFDRAPRSGYGSREAAGAVIDRLERIHGFPLSDGDRAGIRATIARFAEAGPAIRWDPTGSAWIPTFAELMAASDASGVQWSFLASEGAFAVFRRYQMRNRIVPLVGDFGGRKALRAVARYLRSERIPVSIFYTSNVEVYLGEHRAQFLTNVRELPRTEASLFVRTRFHTIGRTRNRPDYETVTSTE
jgi:hypothetical protein